jgi:hypothetical protein
MLTSCRANRIAIDDTLATSLDRVKQQYTIHIQYEQYIRIQNLT